MSKTKKAKQLGMNPSTASHRLVKDILFTLIAAYDDTCCRCGEPMSRDTFSIEHKEAWLDSEDPVGLYFDMDNIDFSHLSCNIAAARRPNKKYHTAEEKRIAKNKSNRKSYHKNKN